MPLQRTGARRYNAAPLRILVLIARIIAYPVGAVLLIAHAWGLLYVARGQHRFMGNRDENVARLPAADGDDFSFAVMGDPEDGMAVFGHLLNKADAAGCRFTVLTGDVVHGNEEWRYSYLGYKLAEIGFPRPIFAVPGNHDVEPGDYKLFHEYFGPENYFFIYGRCLFIMMDNALETTSPRQAKWLDDVLTKHRKDARAAFVFFHCPISQCAKENPDAPIPDLSLVSYYPEMVKHRVTRIYSGHLHAYRVKRVGELTEVITGGAGGSRQTADATFHFVKVDVHGDDVRETVVEDQGVPTTWDRVRQQLEKGLVWHGFFRFVQRPWIYPMILLPYVMDFMVRRRIKKKVTAAS